MGTIPILPSADLPRTRDSWGRFGFVERGLWPEYLILRSDPLGAELHFWHDAKVDPCTNDVACYVRFADPARVSACRSPGDDVSVPEPARMSAARSERSGAVESHIIDVDGNLVRFGGFAR